MTTAILEQTYAIKYELPHHNFNEYGDEYLMTVI